MLGVDHVRRLDHAGERHAAVGDVERVVGAHAAPDARHDGTPRRGSGSGSAGSAPARSAASSGSRLRAQQRGDHPVVEPGSRRRRPRPGAPAARTGSTGPACSVSTSPPRAADRAPRARRPAPGGRRGSSPSPRGPSGRACRPCGACATRGRWRAGRRSAPSNFESSSGRQSRSQSRVAAHPAGPGLDRLVVERGVVGDHPAARHERHEPRPVASRSGRGSRAARAAWTSRRAGRRGRSPRRAGASGSVLEPELLGQVDHALVGERERVVVAVDLDPAEAAWCRPARRAGPTPRTRVTGTPSLGQPVAGRQARAGRRRRSPTLMPAPWRRRLAHHQARVAAHRGQHAHLALALAPRPVERHRHLRDPRAAAGRA